MLRVRGFGLKVGHGGVDCTVFRRLYEASKTRGHMLIGSAHTRNHYWGYGSSRPLLFEDSRRRGLLQDSPGSTIRIHIPSCPTQHSEF